MKARVDVSPEMVAFVGDGGFPDSVWPDAAIGFTFRSARGTFAFHPDPAGVDDMVDADLAFVVTSAACRRIFGDAPETPATWHLPSAMRTIVLAILDDATPGLARDTMRLAKSIELLCMTFASLADDSLVPADATGALSEAETRRIVAARRLIDERWHEKLTLDSISRACGLNRAKLTRGFRSMFDCSVADAIADRRLGGARQMLLATDLPVSSIGYRCGYLNNASFTRAFSRRFGLAPTQLRSAGVAA